MTKIRLRSSFAILRTVDADTELPWASAEVPPTNAMSTKAAHTFPSATFLVLIIPPSRSPFAARSAPSAPGRPGDVGLARSGQPHGEHPGHHVGSAARREAHTDAHRAAGLLRPHRRSELRGQGADCRAQ